jgi:hypothetical protein
LRGDIEAPLSAKPFPALAVGLLMLLQLGGCVFIGGSDFLYMPLLCSASSETGWVRFFSYSYATGLLIIPLLMMASFPLPRLRILGAVLGICLCVGIATQIVLLDAKLLHCDGP